jgi:4-hydroxy-tetrahydrodipicolinate synthase
MTIDSGTPPTPHNPPQFSGLWIPLITPFQSNGSLDLPALEKLLHHYNALGIAGLVINGTTGEPSALSKAEQLTCLDLALAHQQDKRVIAGISSYSLDAALDAVQDLNQRSLAGILVSAPAYIRPSQAGLIDWFTRIANASAHPIVVYDIPYRSGVALTRETLLNLADHPNICAIKDCGGDPGKTLALMQHGGLQVLAGEDLQIFSSMAQGAKGAIAASAHLHTEQFLAMMQALEQSDLAKARRYWQTLTPWIEAAFQAPNPAPVKAELARQGKIQNVLRPPMQAC